MYIKFSLTHYHNSLNDALEVVSWYVILVKKTTDEGAGEMTQWLRALIALVEDPGSIPITHMAAHNCLKIQLQEI